MRVSRGLLAALLILAAAWPAVLAQRTRPPPPGNGGPVPTPPTPVTPGTPPATRPPPPLNGGGARRPPPPGTSGPGTVPGTPPSTGNTRLPFPPSPFAPLNNPALICVAQDLVHPVNGLPLGIVLDPITGQPTWNQLSGAANIRELLVADMPASPFVITPFQEKYQPLAIKQPSAKVGDICRADGSGHCMRTYEITISDEKLRPFDNAVPRCTQGNFVDALCALALPLPAPPAKIPLPTCTKIDIPVYDGTWFLTYDGMVPGPMMRAPVGHEVFVRFTNRICTTQLAGVIDPLAPPPPVGFVPPATAPECVAQAASPKGIFFANAPALAADLLAAGVLAPPTLCEARLDRNGAPSPGRGRGTSVHHHGSASIAPFDGWAEDFSCWDESKDYVFPINRPTTAWYHDHALHITQFNALFGLASMFVHSARQADGGCGEPWNLDNIPDLPMMLSDKLLDQTCQQYKPVQAEYMFFGDINTLNGVPWPAMDLEPKTYRFRFLNSALSRPYIIRLRSGAGATVDRGPALCKVIAGDGGYRQSPVTFPTEGLMIAVAERYEVVCDFSGVAGSTLYWYNDRDLITFDGGGLQNNQVPYFCWSHLIAQVRVGARSTASLSAPKLNTALMPAADIIPIANVFSQADLNAALAMANAGQFHRSFEFSKVVDMWTINGRTWDTARVAADDVGQNTWELWKLISGGTWFHPVHIHLIDAFIIKRYTFRGATIKAFEQMTPKDVIFLGPTNQVYTIIRFGAHKGEYMFHCHNMVHEDADMMRSFQVQDAAASLMNSGKPSQVATADRFIINPINNVVYSNWQWFDPIDGLSCYDPNNPIPEVPAGPGPQRPLCDAAAQARQGTPAPAIALNSVPTTSEVALGTAAQIHFDRNYYRIFYPDEADKATYGTVTNPWQAAVCALKPAVPNPSCNHVTRC